MQMSCGKGNSTEDCKSEGAWISNLTSTGGLDGEDSVSSIARLALAIHATVLPVPLLAYCSCADSILGALFFAHLPSPQRELTNRGLGPSNLLVERGKELLVGPSLSKGKALSLLPTF